MKPFVSYRLCLCALAYLLVLGGSLIPGAVSAAAAGDGAQDQAANLAELRRRIQELRVSLDSARGEQGRLRGQLRATETEIGRVSLALKRLGERSRQKEDELRGLRAQRDEARAALGRQRELLAQQIVAGYVMGRQGYLKVLLSQQEPAAIGRALVYYDYFNKARTVRIEEIHRGLEEIAALEAGIRDETAALDRLREEQRQQMDALEESRRARRQVLARLDAEIRTKEQRLAMLLEDERRLAELVGRLQEALSDMAPDVDDIPPFPSHKGRLPWPAHGRIAARFGSPRHLGGLVWRGVLIDAAEGEDVRAIYHGRVAFADWLRGFGLLIIIDHGNGYMSLYGHNQSLYKGVGEWVDKGEVIATVGDSGGRTTPGLYFEIRHNGVPDNPLRWCRAQGR